MLWYKEIPKIQPYVFKILTPNGSGTGFQIFRNNQLIGIATAYHVISSSFEWEQPIKVIHSSSGVTKILKPLPGERAILVHPETDLAFIIFPNSGLPAFIEIPGLIDPTMNLNSGNEIGWLGFPWVSIENLCFFTGHTSHYLPTEHSYLIDGVAINGVSGGPAFYLEEGTDQLKICGVISNYFPNRATGETLPGMSMMRSVEPYHADLAALRSFDEARGKAEEQARNLQEQQATPIIPPKEESEGENNLQ